MVNKVKQSILTSILTNIELYIILIYWEALLFYQLHNTLRTISYWNIAFMLPIATFLTFLVGWFNTEKPYINEMCKIIVLFAISAFYFIDLIYFKTFGSLVSVSMLGNGTDALTNFWWSIITTIKENIVAIILLELPIVIEFILMFFRKHNSSYGIINHFVKLILAVAFWMLIVFALPIDGTQDYTAYGAYHSQFVNTDTASKKLGILPNFIVELKSAAFGSKETNSYQATDNVDMKDSKQEDIKVTKYNEYKNLDFSALNDLTDDETISSLCEYLDSVSPSSQNEYTGMFEGYNLIYICAESFSSMAIDKDVTPTLYKMANNSIVLKNYYNSFKNVTTNGEYALLTGIWPNVVRENTNGGNLTGTMGSSIDKDMSIALGNMFNENEGITSRAYHNYFGYYYGRNETLPNMGFDSQFMDDGMEFTTSWPASDLELIEQSIDDYINDKQFCTYYMTFSGHGNYTTDNVMVARNIEEVSSKIDRYLPESGIGYLSCNYELEKAMTYLLDRLEQAGKLDNTVIVLTGDHYPYYLTDYAYGEINGEDIDYDFGMYKSTCIMYNAGMKKNVYVNQPCCNVDILPTIYNLFGINYDSRLYAGRDIFSDSEHIAQLYNMSFISDYVKYNAETGEAEWLINTNDYEQEKLDAYLENVINIVKNRYIMSIEIEESDFFKFLFDNYEIEKEPDMKNYTIKKFDGNWDDIDYLSLDNIQWRDDYGIRSKMQIAYDQDKLYLHMVSKEEDVRHELYGNEDSICEDSCMEFFFGINGSYFNVEVNLNCKYFVGIGTGREDRKRIVDDFEFFNARSNLTNDGWEVYYEIPFTFINEYLEDLKPVSGLTFRANCYKCGDKTAHEHYLTWNKVEVENPDYHRPEYFGEMIFE